MQAIAQVVGYPVEDVKEWIEHPDEDGTNGKLSARIDKSMVHVLQ